MNNNKLIIFTEMVADLFHPGHINFLKQIKIKYPNSLLFVGLMSDEQATPYKRKPILDLKERTIMVESCKYVDKVITNHPLPITKEFLDINKIDYLIHADDISLKSKNYWYKIPISLGVYKEIPYTKGISTTDIISRIKNC